MSLFDLLLADSDGPSASPFLSFLFFLFLLFLDWTKVLLLPMVALGTVSVLFSEIKIEFSMLDFFFLLILLDSSVFVALPLRILALLLLLFPFSMLLLAAASSELLLESCPPFFIFLFTICFVLDLTSKELVLFVAPSFSKLASSLLDLLLGRPDLVKSGTLSPTFMLFTFAPLMLMCLLRLDLDMSAGFMVGDLSGAIVGLLGADGMPGVGAVMGDKNGNMVRLLPTAGAEGVTDILLFFFFDTLLALSPSFGVWLPFFPFSLCSILPLPCTTLSSVLPSMETMSDMSLS